MATTATPAIQTGSWRNYDLGFGSQWQVAVKEAEAATYQLLIGVLVGAAWSAIAVLLLRALHWYQYVRRPQTPRAVGTDSNSGDEPDHNERTPLFRPRRPSEEPRRPSDNLWTRFITSTQSPAFFLLTLGLSYAFATALLDKIPTGDSGLVDSDTCGLFALVKDPDLDPGYTAKEELRQAMIERAVTQYARNCYGGTPVANPDQCNFFEEASIPYRHEKGLKCPFRNSDFCDQDYDSIRFTTGTSQSSLVSSTTIGINSPKPPKFLRRATCTPLNTRKPPEDFITNLPPHDRLNPMYGYALGPVKGDVYRDDEYTFRTLGWGFKWDTPSYAVSTYQYSPHSDEHYWIPRKELDIDPKQSEVYKDKVVRTLIFIQSCRIFYTERSDDPIFPALSRYEPAYWRELWFNSNPKAQVLACVDESKVCTHDESWCQHPGAEPTTKLKGRERDDFEFVRLAMQKSSVFQSIQYGLGSALNASSRIADMVSKGLGDSKRDYQQWVVESEALFQTSLARIQFDALDIAMGVGSDEGDLYQNIALKNTDLCGRYKIKLPKGYKNINWWGRFWCIFIPVLLFALQVELWFEFDDVKKKYVHGNWRVIDGLCKILPRLFRRCWPRKQTQSDSGTASTAAAELPGQTPAGSPPAQATQPQAANSSSPTARPSSLSQFSVGQASSASAHSSPDPDPAASPSASYDPTNP